MDDFNQLKNDIEVIKSRNARVEADKAWEISWVRRVFIAAVTYVIAGAWLTLIAAYHPWYNAFVPAIGYVVSTISLPFVKNWWLKRKV